MSTQVTYETNHISLFCDSTMSSAPNFVFYVFYCNLKEKDHMGGSDEKSSSKDIKNFFSNFQIWKLLCAQFLGNQF